ncbi:MAG TPA: hypothetical protein VLK82_00905 [Candidatus Tectomicrobia bacterium]|nr:hypothetical protein [Candidatus Tectomicrobia bacterium]
MFKIATISDEISQHPAVAAAMGREFGGGEATRQCLESLREMGRQL